LIVKLLQALERHPGTVFVQSELAKSPGEFADARRRKVLRPLEMSGMEVAAFVGGRHLSIVSESGDLIGLDDEDPQFEAVSVGPQEIQLWRVDLGGLALRMQEMNGWSGQPCAQGERLYYLGERAQSGRSVVHYLGLFANGAMAERELSRLAALAGNVSVVLTPQFLLDPLARDRYRRT
jgi:hypothetical protein